MSAEEDTDMYNTGLEEEPSSVLVSGGEEEGGDGDVIEDEDEDEEGEEDGDSGLENQEDGTIIPLDLVQDDDASAAQLYKRLERIEYEALAQRKRKLDTHQGEGGSAKKPREDETAAATFEEILEAMSHGSRRRRRRKQKKRGRRKGGKNKVSPEIIKNLGLANLHFSNGLFEEAISILNEVILVAPFLCDPYHILGLIYEKMGKEKKSMGC